MITRPLFDLPLVRRSNRLRTFLTAAWLGWQIESNWADPFLFAIYSIARPVASVAILVVMYNVISDTGYNDPLFAYIYLGNALYIMVGQVMNGVSWTVIDDREHYRTMKQLHTTPMDYYFYLMGRGVARLIIALISTVITIGVGLVAFDLPIHAGEVNIALLLYSLVLGIICLASLGLILGALTLTAARHMWQIGEAVAGAFYLFTGAIFPITVLPALLQPIGYLLPVTYWLEAMRRALLGEQAAGFMDDFSTSAIVLILTLSTLFCVWASDRVYHWALYQAKDRGLIDMESNY